MFENMTPEQWNQVISILISGLTGLLVFSGLMGRVIYKGMMARIDNHAKAQKADHERETNAYNLKLKELEDEALTKQQLFETNKAHAESGKLVAHAINKIADAEIETKSQIEIFSQQLQKVVTTNTAMDSTLIELTGAINELKSHITLRWDDLIERDVAKDEAISSERQDVQRLLRQIEEHLTVIIQSNEITTLKIEDKDNTKPIPSIDEDPELPKPIIAKTGESPDSAVQNDDEPDDIDKRKLA